MTSSRRHIETDPAEIEARDQALLADFNTWTMQPNEAISRVRTAVTSCPVGHSDQMGGFDIILKYSSVKSAAVDWRTFSIEPSAFRPAPPRGFATPLDLDPPAQAEWRRIISKAFNVRTPHELHELVTADAHAAIDTFAARGSVDLTSEFAEQIPLRALCHALGVGSENTEEFLTRSLALLQAGSDPAEFLRLYTEFRALVVGMVKDRRDGDGSDYLSQLNETEFDGHPLDDEQIGIATVNLIPPGFHTTVSGLASLCYEVFSRPQLRDHLRAHPDDIPGAVEETLRLHPPIFGFYRHTNDSTVVDGTALDADRDVYLCWASANRDPDRFEDPDKFRADRADADKHLSFGWGVHKCPGAPLARMEMTVALAALLERLPDLTVDVAEPAYFFSGMETMSMGRLPATFTPAPPS